MSHLRNEIIRTKTAKLKTYVAQGYSLNLHTSIDRKTPAWRLKQLVDDLVDVVLAHLEDHKEGGVD